MNATIKTFDFKSDYGELLASVRTVQISQSPWFFVVDVCQALGLNDTNKALLSVDDEDMCEHEQYSGSGRKPMLVNESGLYTLILKSRKKQAKRFKRWVTADVLPSIRATGSYNLIPSNDLPDFSDEVAAARAWADEREAARRALGYVERQAKYIEHLENLFQPGMSPCQFCKQLNGVNVQQVNAFLFEHNWLYDDQPKAKYPRWRVNNYARDLYLSERTGQVEQDDGDMRDTFKPILLRKGAVWIYRHYLKGHLPMKKRWDGKFTHDTELAGAA
ncbi:transporter [Citrobacter sp. NCU1]|uniref:BRO-N domain-containing protein n=1 Tax=Citrobacter sp. NCU1 TaxID=2026683 RepID=UPI001391A72F|nr:BRO family protein [Citrobacter sp. NCU1]NDO82645.1 transporter [Citrobacter sp. NCU1]